MFKSGKRSSTDASLVAGIFEKYQRALFRQKMFLWKCMYEYPSASKKQELSYGHWNRGYKWPETRESAAHLWRHQPEYPEGHLY
jgi:hypothetical protein